MHFILSWDTSEIGPQKLTMEEELRECFKSYTHARPFNGLFIIKIDDEDKFISIYDSISIVINRYPETLNLLMSPVINGGRYKGWLPSPTWNDINALTEG